MRLFDHYDWAAVVGVVALTFVGVLVTGAWTISFLLAAGIAYGCAHTLRRRSGASERSAADQSPTAWTRAKR